MHRRSFLQTLGVSYAATIAAPAANPQEKSRLPKGRYSPGRIPNEYSLLLPGEREMLEGPPQPGAFRSLRAGRTIDGWQLLTIAGMNGSETAVFEKHVSHRGMLVFMTEAEGVILRVPKGIGNLASIRPRATNTPHIRFTREVPYVPGPDELASYLLNSDEDPCYENVAALGAEYIGYTLVANEQAGPLRSLFLEADGISRQLSSQPEGQGMWAPDLVGALFDPSRFFPGEDPSVYRYLPGYSKRTLLGGYLPVADIGVWNPESRAGYEVMVLLPPGEDARPMARIRILSPQNETREHYWNTSAEGFFSQLAGIANYWQHFFEDHMKVDIPDPWLLDAARAGITLSRCSYRGFEPTIRSARALTRKFPREVTHSFRSHIMNSCGRTSFGT